MPLNLAQPSPDVASVGAGEAEEALGVSSEVRLPFAHLLVHRKMPQEWLHPWQFHSINILITIIMVMEILCMMKVAI